MNVPSIVSPFDEIDFTWPASTCCRKNGLNGTFTRGSPRPAAKISTDSQLTASSTTTKIQNPRNRCGGRGLCSSGIPRPSGAGATRQPCLSRGIGGRDGVLRVRGRLCVGGWFGHRGSLRAHIVQYARGGRPVAHTLR